MIEIILHIALIFWALCAFVFFYLEDIYRTNICKPLIHTFNESVIQTILLVVSLFGFYHIFDLDLKSLFYWPWLEPMLFSIVDFIKYKI